MNLLLSNEVIGYLINCSAQWRFGCTGYLAPTEKRLSNLIVLAKRLHKKWYRVTPRILARLAGYVVSLRPVFDPAALMFTRHMYIWIQSLVDNGFSYDWHTFLSSEVVTELEVWIAFATPWSRKALWRLLCPH